MEDKNEIAIKFLKLAAVKRLTQEFVRAEIDMFPDIIDSNVFRVITKVDIAYDKLESYSYPADWKEAVKDRFFPDWLKKRFPVIYRVIDIHRVFPDLPPETRDLLGAPRTFTSISKHAGDDECQP